MGVERVFNRGSQRLVMGINGSQDQVGQKKVARDFYLLTNQEIDTAHKD